ncbi:helix-turn-helix transcriptional regulator [Providencia rettgeri]|uniref:helix-turn-helix domain-containing protein n=1 Tax=Providencia rettgeri TaxID=587 RepID=UPI001B3929F4|nr:helix-turn-helix transcriptional regulator [Providencia rettgeri]MBQ0211502.1 helix-turn-helix transcriptional regulator [Providencia rettgeri]MDH2379565.1 helix-turn-helix transcriptional regulator [Providencia rettgeri]MDR9616857.1 helix-turn-helix transcriptional regulator [Providencia rettgeri]MDW7803601.1 helix-turn-helix transcriptional regulator [Providencia rettgeri]
MNETNGSFNWFEIPDNFFSSYCGFVLKKERKELGISGIELARRLNISQQQVSRYERGINKMSLDMLLNISVALNIPMEKFIANVISEVKKNHSSDPHVLKAIVSFSEPVYFY